MNLEDRINNEIKAAMIAKDQTRLRGLRAIKSAILLAKTEKAGTEIDEAKEVAILQKLLKQRKDSLKIYEEQGREDLASKEREEIEVIEPLLPEQMGADDIRPVLEKIIADTGAAGMQDMGKVMGSAMKQLGGKADGSLISSLVKELLS